MDWGVPGKWMLSPNPGTRLGPKVLLALMKLNPSAQLCLSLQFVFGDYLRHSESEPCTEFL